MSDLRKAAETALEALELVVWTNNPPVNKAITELREALAQPNKTNQMLVEALVMADAQLSGANMNLRVLEKKVHAALRQALAQPKQEPVAWIVESKHGIWTPYLDWSEPSYSETQVVTPLYTTPPKREWVGLSDDDLSVCDEDGVLLARYWEAKLKEKNT